MKKLIAILVLMLYCNSAFATTLYMRANGTNVDPDCSGSSPCCVGAMDLSDHNNGDASPGDFIFV